MDPSTLIGVLLGLGALFLSVVMEKGDLTALIKPSAALIVFGGTLGASLASFPLATVIALPKLMMTAFLGKKIEGPEKLIPFFTELANRARKEGLLSLEEQARTLEDPFLRKGLMLVVDGVDPELVSDILKTENHQMTARHHQGIAILTAMAGYAPTMGIIGTVLGLVNVLTSLNDPSQLGEKIGVAFIATLYGVGSANLLWMPLATKLRKRSEAEAFGREVMIEGILAVQAGNNPYIVSELLMAFVAPKARKASETTATVVDTARPVPEPA
jgi:chemotaxis protein MotA